MKMENVWDGIWLSEQATNEEKQLINKVEDFGDYFNDMLFDPDSITYDFIKCQVELQKTGESEETGKPEETVELKDDEFPIPNELKCFSYNFFHFKVEEMMGCDGKFNHQEQALYISPMFLERKEDTEDEKKKKDSIILHELIHLHEFVINDLPLFYHDTLYWVLYTDLKEKIPELDEIITRHAHILTESKFYSKGGLHDILFLLKSLDLDIKKGYPLGTVFDYDRVEALKNYSYSV